MLTKPMRVASIVTGIACLSGEVAAQPGECPMVPAFTMTVKEGSQQVPRRVWKTSDGAALAFRTALAVNTDGTAKSYVALHKFPSMSNLPARFNIICNGVSVTPAGGSKVSAQTPGGCDIINRAVVRMGTKPVPWRRSAGDPLIDWYAIATEMAGGSIQPCVSGEHYVSMTSAMARPRRPDGSIWGRCDQAQWLDAATIPAVVIPKNSPFLNAHSVGSGDSVVFYMPAAAGSPERFVYAIVGDLGPANKLGEATLAAHAQLRGVPVLDPETIRNKAVVSEIARFAARGRIATVVFPRTRPADRILDDAAANASRATMAFADKLGGGQLGVAQARLRACAQQM